MKLVANGVGRERPARQPRPLDRALAFLDPLLASAALVVEGDDPLRRSCHVGDDEADTRIKLSGMPFDLRNHPARLGPASGLIAEVRMKPAHLVWRPPNRTLEQITDPVLEDLVGRQPDRILDPFGFQVFVDARHGEGCVGPEIDARYLALVACDDRLERTVPAAVHVAGT